MESSLALSSTSWRLRMKGTPGLPERAANAVQQTELADDAVQNSCLARYSSFSTSPIGQIRCTEREASWRVFVHHLQAAYFPHNFRPSFCGETASGGAAAHSGEVLPRTRLQDRCDTKLLRPIAHIRRLFATVDEFPDSLAALYSGMRAARQEKSKTPQDPSALVTSPGTPWNFRKASRTALRQNGRSRRCPSGEGVATRGLD